MHRPVDYRHGGRSCRDLGGDDRRQHARRCRRGSPPWDRERRVPGSHRQQHLDPLQINAGTGTSTRGILITGSGNLVEHILVSVSTTAFGIYVSNRKNTIAQNTIYGDNSGGGIELVSGANNCRVDGNSVYGVGGTGISTSSQAINNTVVRNSVIGVSTLPYSMTTGNQFGPIVSSDTIDATVSPWANFSQP